MEHEDLQADDHREGTHNVQQVHQLFQLLDL